MGLFSGLGLEIPESALSGAQRYASAVQAAICEAALDARGSSMMLRVPRSNPAMYSGVDSPPGMGWGPCGLASGIIPFPLATRSVLPSGVTRTEVGYQPTGIKPRDRLLPGVATSKTATAFTFALATNKVRSSGDKARLLGVAPGGDWGKNAAQIVSMATPVSVSKTVTVFRLALATNRKRPERVKAISQGCSSVGHRAHTRFEFKSTTATAACPH